MQGGEDSRWWRLIQVANRVSGFEKSVIGQSFLGTFLNKIRRS